MRAQGNNDGRAGRRGIAERLLELHELDDQREGNRGGAGRFVVFVFDDVVRTHIAGIELQLDDKSGRYGWNVILRQRSFRIGIGKREQRRRFVVLEQPGRFFVVFDDEVMS